MNANGTRRPIKNWRYPIGTKRFGKVFIALTKGEINQNQSSQDALCFGKSEFSRTLAGTTPNQLTLDHATGVMIQDYWGRPTQQDEIQTLNGMHLHRKKIIVHVMT